MTERTDASTGLLRARKWMLWLTIVLVVVGCAFLAWSRFAPHRTAVVTGVGRARSYTTSSGRGRHGRRHDHTVYACDVSARALDNGEEVTVYCRAPERSKLPTVGDEIEFTRDLFIGNAQYPQKWQARLGLFLLGLGALALFIRTVILKPPKRWTE